ncbi:MAG: putative Pterin-4a-carbinolamine dehydratase [bacterium]|jgi:4a-hydroxytetrahydrobiopterin dehydratase|nr:MAG: putative Pterin-4a-carbinolamine dehydratase [bacterium]KAF0147685.1 MAG: putative Pterin-4a-carbinolamine dehydratase [bacterium]KAF0166772.1 MAG: putative Pterin-4a-carbinolamine dehydratase [bacterium]
MADLPEGWEARGTPPNLFRRFEFARYGETRAFLDALAALTEETGLHPQNINFGTTYVNITVEAAEGTAMGEREFGFAARVNALRPAAGS